MKKLSKPFTSAILKALAHTRVIYGYGRHHQPATSDAKEVSWKEFLTSTALLSSGELGITTQTVSCTSAASGAFQQLTFGAISPSKAGWVTLQIASCDTGGTGAVHFDTLAVA